MSRQQDEDKTMMKIVHYMIDTGCDGDLIDTFIDFFLTLSRMDLVS